MFTWHVEPPASWVADLRLISPPQDRLSHAELWWEAGFPWKPTQRWLVYELTRIEHIRADHIDGILGFFTEGPPCSCGLEWRDTEVCRREKSLVCERCGGRRSQTRERIWRTWTDRKYWAQPLWIIQGSEGGHPAKAPHPVPAAGSLPYVGWDWRVKRNLLAIDLAHSRFGSLHEARRAWRNGRERARRVASEQQLNRDFAEIGESTNMTAIAESLPRVEGNRYVDENALQAQFIETGVWSHG